MNNYPEDIEFIEDRFKKFVNYFNAVYDMVISSEANKALLSMDRISIEEFQDRIKKADESRRIFHDSAIAACNQINRLCDNVNLPHICPDTNDRYIIADFIGSFVYNIYEEEISKNISIDEAIENARTSKKHENNQYAPKEIEKIKEVENDLSL